MSSPNCPTIRLRGSTSSCHGAGKQSALPRRKQPTKSRLKDFALAGVLCGLRQMNTLSRLYERGKLHSMGRMTLITGAERRRRWRSEDRPRILAAIAEPGAVVADVARREDVCTSLVYKVSDVPVPSPLG
ncbi:transposase [Methylocapsa aurea]|uniref:transposase n=1 Tax=Methylocapsa aurea TaxID=663610 RepID=UPI003D187E26